MEGVGVQTCCGVAVRMGGGVGWHVGGCTQAGEGGDSDGGRQWGSVFSGCYGYDDDGVMMLMTMTMAVMVTGWRWGTSGDSGCVVVTMMTGCR